MTKRLLVVDDDSTNRLLVLRCLANQSELEVVACESGEEVLERLNGGEHFDWLLVDWNMPEMSGYELVCLLRAQPRFDPVRIMMLTAQTAIDDVKQALEAGANEYLMKPFTKEMLLQKLVLLENS
jgi:two-component system, chemotaxis family, chemotaxis protein CheY